MDDEDSVFWPSTLPPCPVMDAATAALVLQCNAWFAAKMYDAGWMTAEEAKMFGVQPDENRP